MARATGTYMTVETTALHGSVCFSLENAASDVENGAIVGKGDLVTGKDSIYAATDAYTDGKFLVANPAWSYKNNSVLDQNEELFINKAGVPFRVYKLEKDMVYKVANLPVDLTIGDYVEYTAGAYAKAAGTTDLKVVAKEEIGFPYCVGSYGTVDSTYGGVVTTANVKYTIQVVG